MEGLGSFMLSDQVTHQPVRSISLPSRIHPISVILRAALNRLSIWQRSSSSASISASFGSETLHVGLMNLTELYGCVQELLQSPHAQTTLLQYQKGKLLEDSLEGSVVLLDTCETARNVIVAMRDHLQKLRSALRRKAMWGSDIKDDVHVYVNLRKKAKKEIMKHISELKRLETRYSSFNGCMDGSYEATTMANVLRETIGITVSILRHVLLFLSPTTSSKTLKSNGRLFWISKMVAPLMSSPPDSSEKAFDPMNNEVQSLDRFLGSIDNLRSGMRDKGESNSRIVVVEKKLGNLDSRFGGLETGLDSMLKCLVQNRVSFLNIFSRTV